MISSYLLCCLDASCKSIRIPPRMFHLQQSGARFYDRYTRQYDVIGGVMVYRVIPWFFEVAASNQSSIVFGT